MSVCVHAWYILVSEVDEPIDPKQTKLKYSDKWTLEYMSFKKKWKHQKCVKWRARERKKREREGKEVQAKVAFVYVLYHSVATSFRLVAIMWFDFTPCSRFLYRLGSRRKSDSTSSYCLLIFFKSMSLSPYFALFYVKLSFYLFNNLVMDLHGLCWGLSRTSWANKTSQL